MTDKEIKSLFSQAAKFDRTLRITGDMDTMLENNRVLPRAYDRSTLFRNMADGKVSLFLDYPSPLKTRQLRNHESHAEVVLQSYEKTRIQKKIRIRTGKSKTEKYFTVRELAAMWRRNRALMNVTDFHFRDTDIENTIDPKRLSLFNLYPQCTDDVAGLEMMTLVVSSVGGFSDSHSDDSDGSNHCFTGKKLWLAWDTHEGMAAGLEDLDRQDVYSTCRFDMKTWLKLDSASWFTVEPGQTLFMPGHLTHKVVTLEPYLGVGSFYVSLPNCLRTLSRWLLHRPNWEVLEQQGFRDELFPEMAGRIATRLKRLEHASQKTKEQWGYDFLPYAVSSWEKQFSAREKQQVLDSGLLEVPNTTSFIDSLRKAA